MNNIIRTSAKAISLIFLSGIFTVKAFSQQNGKLPFITCHMETSHGNTRLQFGVPKEVNIKYYLVEAGNDSTGMDIIARIPAKSNSVLPQHYQYELTTTAYSYYRVRSVAMDQDIVYSGIISIKTPDKLHPEYLPAAQDATGIIASISTNSDR